MNEQIQTLANLLTHENLKVSVAESCTAGALASVLTSISGASGYFDRGYITYSNRAKTEVLNVDPQVIGDKGAVSEEVALEMVKGVVNQSNSDVAVSITGVAGPTGGTKDKPVGTVCFGFCVNQKLSTSTQLFQGDRAEIIEQSVRFSVNHLISLF
jgi:nicotinamide-nucleotide amidase